MSRFEVIIIIFIILLFFFFRGHTFMKEFKSLGTKEHCTRKC